MKKYLVITSKRVTQNFPSCLQHINARKHIIYLTMLIVLPLNTQIFSGNFRFLCREKITFRTKRRLINSFYRYYIDKRKYFDVKFKVWMRILSSFELSTTNADLSTGLETTTSFSNGRLLGWI